MGTRCQIEDLDDGVALSGSLASAPTVDEQEANAERQGDKEESDVALTERRECCS